METTFKFNNRKDLSYDEFSKQVTDQLKRIGVQKIDQKLIKKGYNKYLSTSDVVSNLL